MPLAKSRIALGLMAVAIFAACAAPPAPVQGFRDTAAPFASTQRFETEKFLGDWVRVAAFAPSGQPVAPERHRYQQATTGQIIGDVTGMNGATQRQVYDLTAPGRLRAQGQDDPSEALWLLWVDEGFRTAVLGTPSGSRAFILDRSATPAPDRIRAAREILDWYGYDMTRLQSGS